MNRRVNSQISNYQNFTWPQTPGICTVFLKMPLFSFFSSLCGDVPLGLWTWAGCVLVPSVVSGGTAASPWASEWTGIEPRPLFCRACCLGTHTHTQGLNYTCLGSFSSIFKPIMSWLISTHQTALPTQRLLKWGRCYNMPPPRYEVFENMLLVQQCNIIEGKLTTCCMHAWLSSNSG